jgi:hypothetical protein
MLKQRTNTNEEIRPVGSPIATLEEGLPPASPAEELIRKLKRSAARRERARGALYIGAFVGFWGLAVAFAFRSALLGEWDKATLDMLPYLAYTHVVAMFIGLLFVNRRSLLTLTDYDDVRLVGPLVDIFQQRYVAYAGRVHRSVEEALTKLLPKLKASDAHLLSEEHRVTLREVLATNGYNLWGRYYSGDFLLAILSAMEQVGDVDTYPIVTELSEHAREERVKEAAKASLPTFQLIAEKQAVGATLLRPSGQDEGGQTLLRSARGQTGDEPDHLLRVPINPH